MARNKKTHHPIVSSDFQAADEQVDEHNVEASNAFTVQGRSEGQETSMAPEVADTLTILPETAQEIWELLREEFYEQIEQLPLSLHRSYTLIGEQDKEVQACQAELLPAIRSYVRLRQSTQSIQVDAQRTETQVYGYDSQFHHGVVSRPSSVAPDLVIQPANPYVSEEIAERQPNGKPPSRVFPMPQAAHKEEDLDVTIDNVASQLSNSLQRGTAADLQSPAKSTLQDTSNHKFNRCSQSGAMRTQGLRETDATVPKSAPFPPRPKPKTTRELLTRISFLIGELLRASEEKVGLATAAYDSVDRHVQALDATIKEHQDIAVPGLGGSTLSLEKVTQEGNDVTVNEEDGEDDEEPQLGMIGPLAETDVRAPPRLRRHRKRDRRDQQKHIVNMQPPTHVHASSTATHQESVDPHEPRYCYCNQVSYGEMIACDNADCSREWFHLGCAGLATPPKGKVKWYCRDCEELLGSNRRRRVH